MLFQQLISALKISTFVFYIHFWLWICFPSWNNMFFLRLRQSFFLYFTKIRLSEKINKCNWLNLQKFSVQSTMVYSCLFDRFVKVSTNNKVHGSRVTHDFRVRWKLIWQNFFFLIYHKYTLILSFIVLTELISESVVSDSLRQW